MRPKLRFAPSPNGYLHIGHGFSAMLNAQLAKELNAEFLLRIEDIDTTRSRPHFQTAIIEDLESLGLTFTPPRIQSEHFAFYQQAIDKLQAMDLLYQDYNTRQSKQDTRFALKLNLKRALKIVNKPLYFTDFITGEQHQATPEIWGDVVLKRKEIPTSYHLSVVLDDALQGITHIVRGQDLFTSTHVHVVLQELLGLKQPLYHHHPLIMNETGEKLAKSQKALAMRNMPQNEVISAISKAIEQWSKLKQLK